MDKKADWRQSLREALKDKRLIGAGIAGLAGGAAGAFGLPDLIYKKPTAGSRVGLGLTSAAIAAAATAAAMSGGQKEDPSLAKSILDVGHNIPSLLQRKEVPELKSMSGLTRFIRGYGGGWFNPFRRIYSGLPDWNGLISSKSNRQIKLEAQGKLPKSDEPSPWLSRLKLVNLPLAGWAGVAHVGNINKRFQQREMGKQLVKVLDSMPSRIKNPLLNSPEGANIKQFLRRADPNKSTFWGNAKDTWLAKLDKLKWGEHNAIPRLKNYNATVNPNTATSSLIDRILALKDSAGNDLVGTVNKKDYRDLLSNIKNTKYKRSFGGKVWAHTRGVGRSLAILALLGAAQQAFGGSKTLNTDLARNLNLE